MWTSAPHPTPLPTTHPRFQMHALESFSLPPLTNLGIWKRGEGGSSEHLCSATVALAAVVLRTSSLTPALIFPTPTCRKSTAVASAVVCSNNCRAHLHKKGERFALPTVLSFLSGGGESSSCLSSLTVLAFSTVPPRQEGQERRAPSTQKKKRKERSSLCQRGEKRGLVFVFLFLAAFPALLASLLSSTLWGWSAAASFLSSLLGMNLAGAGGGGRGEEKKPPPRPSFLLLLLCRQVKKDVYLG